MDPLVSFQTAQAALLLASTSLTALVGTRVLDPMSAVGCAFPYVEIADDHQVGDNDQFSGRSEIFSNVHIWATGPSGGLVCRQIAGVVRPILSQTFALSGHTMLSAQFIKSVPMVEADPSDPDGLLAHLVLTFQYRTEPNPS